MRVAGMPAAIAAAIMAPVEVPATNEKVSRAGRPVVASSLANATAGMMPRMPPPSMLNRYRRGMSPPSKRSRPLAEDYRDPVQVEVFAGTAGALLEGLHDTWALAGPAVELEVRLELA